jgi:hypothetical protein
VDDGEFEIVVAVEAPGGVVEDRVVQRVVNVAPVISADAGDVAGEVGVEVAFGVEFVDPGLADAHTVTFDFGAGDAPVVVDLAVGERAASASWVYEAAGAYALTATVSDDAGASGSVTRTVTVTEPPVEPDPDQHAPVAYGVTVETVEDVPVDVVLRATDGEVCELAFRVEDGPSQGSLGALRDEPCVAGAPNSDQVTVTYTPAAGFAGTDSFTFVADDGTLVSEPATVSVVVQPGESEPPPVASVEYRGGSVASTAGAGELSVARPVESAGGDVLVASITVRGKPTIAPPAGWTLVRTDSSGNVITTSTFVRVLASDAEPAVYGWSWAGQLAATGQVLAYRGVDAADPVMAAAGQSAGPRSTTIVAPSVTTTGDGAHVVGLFGVATATTITAPEGTTLRTHVTSSGGVTAAGASFTQASAGDSGALSATVSDGERGTGHTLALRPARP